MKQSTFKAKLNQYYNDVDKAIDNIIEEYVDRAILEKPYCELMQSLGVDDEADYTDIMFDIIMNEEEAREKGTEPVRRMFYRYADPGDDPNGQERTMWIEYTEDDYLFLARLKEEMMSFFTHTSLYNAEAMRAIRERFSDDADLITAECLTILHTATKADCKEFFDRTRKYIKSRHLDEETEAYVLNKYRSREEQGPALRVYFFQPITEPFKTATQEIHKEERRKNDDRDPKQFLDDVYSDTRIMNGEIPKVVARWYGEQDETTRDFLLRHDKLARTKEINALQTLNLARDSRGTKRTSTSSGGLSAVQVFENNNVEILTTRIEDLSLSTNTRQLLDYYFFKGIEQIPHKGSIERLYRQRSVTVDLDELATVFSIDKKDARKRLNNFYDEVRDLKIKLHYYVKDGKRSEKYIATVNIFDADVQKIDQEEKNATARPEDVDEGVQITLYNTGTLLNYNPKRKKEPKNAVQRGRLTMQFSMDFARHLSQASVVRHNPKGYLVNRRKYTSAYSVQCTLENHAYMNKGKSNEGVISVETLLKDCYEIPTYDTVMNGNRNITARIKKPFLSNVQALKDIGVLQDFSFFTADKKTIKEAKLLSLDYDDFIKCTLHFKLAPIEE